MPSSKPILLTLLLLTRLAAAQAGPPQLLVGQVVDSTNGGPVLGAQVYVTDATGAEHVLVTDRTGHYAIGLAPGAYDVVFVFGTSRTQHHVAIEPGHPAILDGKVDSASGEVIEILEKRPPKVDPKPKNFPRRKVPPYSDEALAKDAWTRAWMMLDISATGEVTRFKFLKRPGYDLENIAAAEVWKLKFEPGRDDNNRPIRTLMVWRLEWPSNGWLNAYGLPRTMLPEMVGFPPRAQSERVPCKGSGPMLLYSVYPTYRDCSRPDLSKMAHEPWIVKP